MIAIFSPLLFTSIRLTFNLPSKLPMFLFTASRTSSTIARYLVHVFALVSFVHVPSGFRSSSAVIVRFVEITSFFPSSCVFVELEAIGFLLPAIEMFLEVSPETLVEILALLAPTFLAEANHMDGFLQFLQAFFNVHRHVFLFDDDILHLLHDIAFSQFVLLLTPYRCNEGSPVIILYNNIILYYIILYYIILYYYYASLILFFC